MTQVGRSGASASALRASPPIARIRANILIYRERLGWSLAQAAERAGITKSHLWELEQGRATNPTLQSLAGLAGAYGMALPELLFDGIYEGQRHKDCFDRLDKCREMLRAEQHHSEQLAAAADRAQGIEAGTAETRSGSVVDESPVAAGVAMAKAAEIARGLAFISNPPRTEWDEAVEYAKRHIAEAILAAAPPT